MKYFDVEAVLPLYFADQEKSYVEYLHDERNIQTHSCQFGSVCSTYVHNIMWTENIIHLGWWWYGRSSYMFCVQPMYDDDGWSAIPHHPTNTSIDTYISHVTLPYQREAHFDVVN